jgi:hypothetical protein
MSALQSRTLRQTEQWQQQQQQQQQMPKQQQQQWRWSRQGPLPPPLSHKPYVVRIAGRTSSIQGAAGAITKRLRTDVSYASFHLLIADCPFSIRHPMMA